MKLIFLAMNLMLASCLTVGTEIDRFPDVIITTESLSVGGAFDITINVTKETSDFVIGDISVSNGTKSNFVSVTSKLYTCTITPTLSGNVVLSVPGASLTSSGYPNRVSNTLTVNYSSGGVDARVFIIGGQSNVIPGANQVSLMPSYLLAEIDVNIWDNVNNVFEKVDLPSTVDAWPVVKFAYDIRAKYPDEEIYIIQHGVPGTSLANDWGQGATRYNQLLSYHDAALATISDRNFIQKSFIWIQGEKDSQGLTNANNYQTRLSSFVTAVRTDFGITKFVDCNIYVNLPAGSYPYSATVRTAKSNVDSGDANFFLANSDAWIFQADDVHLSEDGVVSAGEYAASVL